MESPTLPLAVTVLLEDAGISVHQICEKVLSESVSILQNFRTTDEPHTLMLLLSNLKTLTHFIHKSQNKLDCLCQRVVEGVVKPCFKILLEDEHSFDHPQQQQYTNAIQQLVLALLKIDHPSQQCVMDCLTSILGQVTESLLSPSGGNTANTLFKFVSDTLQLVSIESLEASKVDLSTMFEMVLSLLKISDSKMCFLLASSIIPRFITSSLADRPEKVWSLIESVYLERVNIEHERSEFVLTLLCCLRDVFIHHDKSSPFSTPFPKSVLKHSPLVDLRGSKSFWKIIQDGLISSNPFSRKRCMYLLHCVLVSVEGSLGGDEIRSEGDVFWWSKECAAQLKMVWNDLVLVLETMEEKQIHIVKPVKKHLTNVLNAARQQINGHYLLHMSWALVALSRVFDHHEAKSIIQWGVLECLGVELTNSPLLHKENWSFICGKLLQVLGQSFLYNRVQSPSQDCCPLVAKELVSFLQKFVSGLEQANRGVFLAQFLAACAEQKLAEVPLVYVSYAVSELPSEPIMGREGLAAVRSIILSAILTHKPSLRAASQCFLLKAVCELTNSEEVGYLDVLQTLGSFRESECLVVGSKAWKQASDFLLRFSTSKNQSSGHGLFSYLQICIQAYLNVTHSSDDPLPTISILARALLLALDGDPRIFSTESCSLLESLTSLLAPVMDTITTATSRAYLSAEVVGNAVEFLSSLLHLLPSTAVLGDTGCTLYRCLTPWLGDAILYIYSQLLLGSKVGGIPDLDHTLFYMNTLDCLYNFMSASGFSFNEHQDISLFSLAQKAVEKLASCTSQGIIEVSPSLLGSITTLGWLSSRTLHNDMGHSSLVHILSTVLTTLPVPLHISRPTIADESTNGVDSVRSGVGGVMACSVRVEWGPLVSHCLSSYWNCLLFMMGNNAEWVTKRGVNSLIEVCLDGLDSASSSLPIIIQCLSILTNKNPSGPSLACTIAERLWSLVAELTDQPKSFYEAFEAFVQFVFHQKLLLSGTESLTAVQEEYVKEVFSLGESKTKVCHILVSHVCSVWRRSFNDDSKEHISQLLCSLSAHKQLLLEACTFGTVHRKTLRIIGDTEDFLTSVGIDACQEESFRSDCGVRVKMITFLLELLGLCSHSTLCNKMQDFLHDFVSAITSEILKSSGNTPKYYINSHTHRVKLRLLQLLVLSLKHTSKTTCKLVGERLVSALQYDNQRSVRYLMEWSVVIVLGRFPDLIRPILYPCLDVESEGRLSRMCSFFTIAMHTGLNMATVNEKADYYIEMIPIVLKWTTSQHFSVRLYSQQTLYRMWQDCQRSKVTTALEKFGIVGECIVFMQEHGDCGKFSHKLDENAFLSCVDTVNDINIQTIFHTLPFLCDSPREDLISPEAFLGEASSVKLPCEVFCKNDRLLDTVHSLATSRSAVLCGSDTKSIAHQLRAKANDVVTEGSTPAVGGSDIQKKITPWSNPKTIVNELFPGSLSSVGVSGLRDKSNGLVLVTSLLSKAPNIGGLCRTSEIFGVSELVVDNIKILEGVQFKSLSVTAEKWIPITEVKLCDLKDYLLSMQRDGYTLLGAEQTAQSICLTEYSFKKRTVLLLGNEREGIPVDLIHLLDDCVEIPQLGVIRSLNVHVSGALLLWEYAKKNSLGNRTQS